MSIVSVHPVVLPDPDRGADLHVRLSAPASGHALPVILFSHGFGSSMDGYAPLVDDWAAHGFVVIQPTHLDSRRLALAEDDPRRPDLWRHRVNDLIRVLDHLSMLEAALPGLAGRVDHQRIAVAGHSFGAQTASMLLGARMVARGPGEDLRDARISAGVLLAAGGRGGDDLSAFAKEHLPYLDSSFSHLTTPTLVVAGDHDHSPLTVRGPDWFTDPYTLSPGARGLLTLVGGEHMLGGISGYDVAETTDENPARVALVARTSRAFLETALGVRETAWDRATVPAAEGRIDRK